ncbi:dehydrogenase/reductase SDR family member 7-like isoform X3 [Oscarella lobularis]|uniref:dehydrogenase/reductase SDR family member 7-like isoform X3 n=1 Tax=Oscarella lobularis TaxID=121494 RepID=UPI0033139E1B
MLALLVPTLLIALLVYLGWKYAMLDCDLTLSLKSRRRGHFKDKVIWITGASSGIGLALTELLSEDEAKLILSSRRESELEEVRKNVTLLDNAKILPLDLTDPKSLANIGERAWSLFGHVDILINNAGISTRILAENAGEDVLQQVMDVDFFGPVRLTKAILPLLLERGKGHIVNVVSLLGKFAMPMRAPYCAAKHGLVGYMDVLRAEVASRGLSVVNLMPGPVITNISKNALTAGGTLQETDAFIATGMQPERCAHLMLNAIANNVYEAWISKQYFLSYAYLSQYLPSIQKLLAIRSVRN